MNVVRNKCLPALVRNSLAGRHNLRNIIANTSWLFADKIIRMGVGLIIGVWVARYLGPEQFGIFSYVLAFVGLFGAIAGLGLDSVVIRDLVCDPEAKDSLLGTAFLLRLVGGVISLLIAVAAIIAVRPEDHQIRSLVAIISAMSIFQAFDAIDFWFQARIQSKFSVYARNGAFLIIAVTRVVLILMEAPLVAFAWAALAEVALAAIGLNLAYRVCGQRIVAWVANGRLALRLLRETWPLIIAGMAVMLYMKIDQVMLGEMLGDEAVGIYSAAVRISEIWYFIPIGIVSSVTPALIEARGRSEELYYQRIGKLFRLVGGLALVIAVPMTFVSDFVIRVLYGQQYSEAGLVLGIHIWSAVFVFLGVAQGPWTTNEGLMKLALSRTLVGAIANIALNLVLIPHYGAIGAAVATLISYALSAVILNAFDKRTKRIFRLQLTGFIPFIPIRT